jgi:hypothetical protein
LGFALTCIAGPTFRACTEGTVAKAGGDILYAVGVYAFVLLLRPRTTGRVTAAIAVAVCWAVEFAQLTPFPAEASRHSTLSRLVLGSTFHPPDLAYYLIGVLLAAAVSAHRARAHRARAHRARAR